MTTQSGLLWSLLRSTLTQGAAIAQYNADKTTERYSAQLDDAASVRIIQLEALLATAQSAETEADQLLIEKMADILRRTAIALRGPEPTLTSWHDLPELAERAVADKGDAPIVAWMHTWPDGIAEFYEGAERPALNPDSDAVCAECKPLCFASTANQRGTDPIASESISAVYATAAADRGNI